MYLCFYASFTYTLLQSSPLFHRRTTPTDPARARTTPQSKLPLYETNAALAHFDRMQFSLFYSFPFLFLHLSGAAPHPSRWRVGAMKLYQNINVYVSACMNFAYLVFVCCAHEIRCAVCFNIFFFLREKLFIRAQREIFSPQSLWALRCAHEIAVATR